MGEGVEIGVPEDSSFPIEYTRTVSPSYSSTSNKRINFDGSISSYASELGSIHLFLDRLTNWEFSPPSSNLWTVDIKLHSAGTGASVHSLSSLYNNIQKALERFKNTYATKFAVNVNQSKLAKYLTLLQQEKLNIFLANMVTANTYSVSVEDSIAPGISQHGGFITAGKSITGRNQSLQCSIQFIQSNYEISEILFDQWIAAIAAQGLIQDPSLPELRSDIFLYNYAASHPDKPNASTWILRKTIALHKAFPISRGGMKATYEPNDAGTYKNDQINFRFSDYSIEYHL